MPSANTDGLLRLYRAMRRIRVFETLALESFRDGEIPGYLHASIGQEAVPVGVCAHLRRDDRLTSTHRGHGHGLAKGADVDAMMAELFGRATGACKGKGGSMHIADFGVGMLGANGIVAGGLPIAVGAAQGLKLLGSDAVVACFFGDGATNRGPFLEALNWAALYGLRVLFVCEDNTFSAFTYTDATSAGEGPLARARACGIDGVSVDGDDVLAVERAAGDLVTWIRREGRPAFLHARTYRWYGHTAADQALYRRTGELEKARAHDPLLRVSARLNEAGIEPDRIAEIDAEVDAEMHAAREAARAAPWPAAREAYDDVQDLGAPTWA